MSVSSMSVSLTMRVECHDRLSSLLHVRSLFLGQAMYSYIYTVFSIHSFETPLKNINGSCTVSLSVSLFPKPDCGLAVSEIEKLNYVFSLSEFSMVNSQSGMNLQICSELSQFCNLTLCYTFILKYPHKAYNFMNLGFI